MQLCSLYGFLSDTVQFVSTSHTTRKLRHDKLDNASRDTQDDPARLLFSSLLQAHLVLAGAWLV